LLLRREFEVFDLLRGFYDAIAGLRDLHHVHFVDYVLDRGEERLQACLDWQTLLLVNALLSHLNQPLGRDVLVPFILLRLLLTHLPQILRHDVICLLKPIRMLLLSLRNPLLEPSHQFVKFSILRALARRLLRQHLDSIRKVQMHKSEQVLCLQEHLLGWLEQFWR